MSKMIELDLCVGELRSAAQSLNTVADSLTALFSGSQPEMTIPIYQDRVSGATKTPQSGSNKTGKSG